MAFLHGSGVDKPHSGLEPKLRNLSEILTEN